MAAKLTEIPSRAALEEFDSEQFATDLDELSALQSDAATDNQRIGAWKKRVEKERGYHMRALEIVHKAKKRGDDEAGTLRKYVNEYFDALGITEARDLLDAPGVNDIQKARTKRKVAEIVM